MTAICPAGPPKLINPNLSQNKKVILSLGRISWKKGFDTLIPAFAEILKKETEAVLVIAGPDDENYKKEIILKIKN
jgi:glycosyltransferase involved in cell wall biosynthesis